MTGLWLQGIWSNCRKIYSTYRAYSTVVSRNMTMSGGKQTLFGVIVITFCAMVVQKMTQKYSKETWLSHYDYVIGKCSKLSQGCQCWVTTRPRQLSETSGLLSLDWQVLQQVLMNSNFFSGTASHPPCFHRQGSLVTRLPFFSFGGGGPSKTRIAECFKSSKLVWVLFCFANKHHTVTRVTLQHSITYR